MRYLSARTILALPAALLLLPAVAAWSQAVPVPNAGFETVDEATGLPAGWKSWVTPSTAAYTLAMAHSGVACARVTDAGPTVSQGLRCTPVPIDAEKTYEATVWVKITEQKAGGFALYLEFWTGAGRVQDSSVTTSQTGEWVQIKVKAKAPAGAEKATVLIYGGSATVGEAYFDDAALTLVP